MDFIKYWFIEEENKTGCRFIVVDAYNNELAIKYYERNGFTFLFDNEAEEKEYFGITTENQLRTRLMYFDLITLTEY